MRVVLVAGTTATAGIDGISAAGATPELLWHTPSADAEILAYGRPVRAPDGTTHPTPVSPSGCPTPAVVARAVREVCDFDVTVVDAGLGAPTGAPTVSLGAAPGRDVRETRAVPDAREVFERARRFGRDLSGPLMLAETIPGGTTTALGVLRALGHGFAVSSSLPENPVELKRRVVSEGLSASGLAVGDCSDDALAAVEAMGDPVLAATAGLAVGALDAGTDVRLAGGTQQLAAGAVVRRFTDASLGVATTSFVADSVPDHGDACASRSLDLTVTDPGFTGEHVATARYLAGEGKEGVGMGGALALADDRDALPAVRDRIEVVYDRLLGDDESAEVQDQRSTAASVESDGTGGTDRTDRTDRTESTGGRRDGS